MRRDEKWAIASTRVDAFFRDQPDVAYEGGAFFFRSCRITLAPLTGQAMGRWDILRTRVVFEGEATDVETIYRRFFLRFLSAGG